ncbi:hypothetical protein ACTSKR_07750 [Chitinibacteraceae bacterium HSL-7]
MKSEAVEAVGAASGVSSVVVKTGAPSLVSAFLFYGVSVPDLIQILTLLLLVWQFVGIVWRGVPKWWGALGDVLRGARDLAVRFASKQGAGDDSPK